jgi:hypothetical protein
LDFQLDQELTEKINEFEYVSIHCPCKNIIYGKNKKTKQVLEKLKDLCEKLKVNWIVMHPSVIEDFSVFNGFDLPILIENMDKRNEKLIKPEQFRKFREEFDFGFLLDLQHAYEQDSSMNSAKELLGVMGERLKEMHVSGFNDEYKHALVHLSKNREAIE